MIDSSLIGVIDLIIGCVVLLNGLAVRANIAFDAKKCAKDRHFEGVDVVKV
jgi:hypothetical protein